MIDTKINSVDRAWPIMNPDLKIEVSSQQQQTSGQQQGGGGGGGHVVHVNPKFLNGKQPTGVKQENKQQEKQPEKKKIQPDINGYNKIIIFVLREKNIFYFSEILFFEDERLKRLNLITNKPPQQPSQQQPSQHKGGGPPTKRPRTTTTAQHSSSNVSNKSTQRSVKPQQPRVSKQNVCAFRYVWGSRLHLSLVSKSLIILRVVYSFVKSFVWSVVLLKSSVFSVPRKHLRSILFLIYFKFFLNLPEQFFQVLEPSRALGAHAFNIVMNSQPTPSLQPQIVHPPQQQHFPPPQIPTSIANQPQLVMIPQVSSAPPTNLQQPPPFIKEIPPPQITTMTGIPQHNFPPPTLQNIQHNIQNVTPRLPGVPENNRIFVDGKAYEVFYLDQIAVIERNGLPHRVSFAGPSRNVIIDKTAYCMSFGEPIQVSIDDQLHILRFGGPSRELYMGNFPFKGAFGGPSIKASINGKMHEISLCGPPPEVRIDPEPSYELMRYMPAIRQQQIIPQQISINKLQQPKAEAKKGEN
uniref:Uncharacterized protein n=1 Tax=Meloidogyne enterolobii TaxID=390850 RepID=A0A6V7WQU9_MELEN|nr:unnamed protein product [Meloidogyne enterolobii]